MLYLGLFWLIRRADAIIKQQHARLIDAETLAVVGELTSSVAHNLRNPCRRSARRPNWPSNPRRRLLRRSPRHHPRVDRISDRVAELLAFSATHEPQPTPVDLRELLEACCADHRPAFERRAQHLGFHCEADTPVIRATRRCSARPSTACSPTPARPWARGGRCEVSRHPEGRKTFRIDIADSGSGLTPDAQAQMFRPFTTTSPRAWASACPWPSGSSNVLAARSGSAPPSTPAPSSASPFPHAKPSWPAS